MSAPVPNATININKNGFSLGQVTTDASGNAHLTYTPDGSDVPSDSITGSYPGLAGQYNPCNGSVTEPVNNPVQNTVMTITPSPVPGTVGQPVTLTINLSTTP